MSDNLPSEPLNKIALGAGLFGLAAINLGLALHFLTATPVGVIRGLVVLGVIAALFGFWKLRGK